MTKILKAKIVWLPNKLKIVTVNKLEKQIPYDSKHLEEVLNFIKQDGLIFPGVVKNDEIHCGHHRFAVAKKLGYDGMEFYEAETFKEVLKLTEFSQLCYKHYKLYKKYEFT